MILEFKKLHIDVEDTGIYILGLGDCAEGKTVAKLLFDAYSVCGNVGLGSLTYNKEFSEEDYARKIGSFTGRVLLLDRYDKYKTKKLTAITTEKAKQVCILIDSKDVFFWNGIRRSYCSVRFDANSVYIEK